MDLAVLAEPVEFGSKEKDPIDFVFGFSTTDSEAHLELIQIFTISHRYPCIWVIYPIVRGKVMLR